MGFNEELKAIEKESGIDNRDLWSCLQNCYDHNLGEGCSDQCYKNNPTAITPATKAKVKALMERHHAVKK